MILEEVLAAWPRQQTSDSWQQCLAFQARPNRFYHKTDLSAHSSALLISYGLWAREDGQSKIEFCCYIRCVYKQFVKQVLPGPDYYVNDQTFRNINQIVLRKVGVNFSDFVNIFDLTTLRIGVATPNSTF